MNQDEPPRVDVTLVIPVRNGGEYLLRAVKSVERVAVVSSLVMEVVVVDDGADVPIRQTLDSAYVTLATSVIDGPCARTFRCPKCGCGGGSG